MTKSYEIISHDNGALSVYVRAARRYVEQFYLMSDKPDEAAKYADVAEVSQQR